MSEFPDTWAVTTLGEVCSHPQYGFTTSSSRTGSIRFLRTTDISSGKVDWSKVPYCEEEPKDIGKYLLRKNDILVSRAGSVGISYLIESAPSDNAVFASYLIRFNVKDEINPRYISYYLKSSSYWSFISESSAGIAVPNVNASKLAELPVPLPPLNEQKRIVAKLDELLPKVEACKQRLERIPTIVKRFRQSVLAAAMSGKLTEQWRTQNPVLAGSKSKATQSLNGQTFGSDMRSTSKSFALEVPSTWSWSNLQHLGELARGKSKHRPRDDARLYGSEYPFIQTGDVARAKDYVRSHSKCYSEFGLAQSRRFPTGTLCITIAANIGDTAILTYPCCFPDSVVAFIPHADLYLPEMAMYWVQFIQTDLEAFAPATAQKNINLEILQAVAVPVPPLDEQREIVRILKSFFHKQQEILNRLEIAKGTMEQTTNSILCKAFLGTLVDQCPTDEPASLLLERIKSSALKLKKASSKKQRTEKQSQSLSA